jgi:hypothetical protein
MTPDAGSANERRYYDDYERRLAAEIVAWRPRSSPCCPRRAPRECSRWSMPF